MEEPDFEVGRRRLLDTEENCYTGHDGVFVNCPDPDCTVQPTLGYIVKNGECICGHKMAVVTLSEEM